MSLLEIVNRSEVRPLIAQIDQFDVYFPPTVMLYVTLKGIALMIFNIIMLFFMSLAGWEVVDGNKRDKVSRQFIKSNSSQL